MQTLIYLCGTKYLKSIFIFLTSCSRDMKIYFVYSAFTSRTNSLLATDPTSVDFFIVSKFSPRRLTLSASSVLPGVLGTSLFYTPNDKVKSNGDKASPCFRPLWVRNVPDVCPQGSIALFRGEGKVYPTTGHEGPEVEWSYRATLSLTSALYGGGWSMPMGKNRYPLHYMCLQRKAINNPKKMLVIDIYTTSYGFCTGV
jgi:hypothetical protein